MKNKKITDDKKFNLALNKAASPNDCTGLIQVPPESEYEYDSYYDVYDFSAPTPPKKDKGCNP